MTHATAADGTRISYDRFGRSDGFPLVMVPGLGSDSRNWAMQRLAFGRKFRCFAIDNRGTGSSDRPDPPYTIQQMSDDLLAVLDAEGIDRAHIMGASMGGVITQMFAIEHPDRVAGLVFACTACRHHEWRRELFLEGADAVRERGMQAMAEDGMEWLLGPRLRRRFGMWINILARMLMQVDPEVFAAQVDALLAFPDSLRFALAEVQAPSLVITGSQDMLTPVGDAEELAEIIPDARLTILSRAAHGLMVEAPNSFNATVLDFLETVPTTV
jgi:3-oxoadipate enol-lactonase